MTAKWFVFFADFIEFKEKQCHLELESVRS